MVEMEMGEEKVDVEPRGAWSRGQLSAEGEAPVTAGSAPAETPAGTLLFTFES